VRPVIRLVAILYLAALLAACTRVQTGQSGGRHGWSQPNIARVVLFLEPSSLNPILSTSTGEVMVDTMIFDPLVTVDDKGNDVPVLAAQVPTLENGGISKDGLTLTYKLRKNVKWHDGASFTADDVKFSWQAVMNPANNVQSRKGFDVVQAVDTPDAYTVVFHMKRPYAPAIETLFSESDSPYRVLPKHLLSKYPNINRIPFNSQPVGTGPFKFVKWVRGDRIEMVTNPDYFLGKPKLKRVIWKVIPDSNTQDAQMRSHEVDLVPELGGPQYRDLRNHPDISIVLSNSPQYEAIGINMSRPFMNDLKVRRALAYAIDKRRVADDTQFGTATLATEDLPTYMWAYNPKVVRYDYDPKKAAQTLDGDGWKLAPDGVREKNGQRLSLQFSIAQGSAAASAISVIVQSQLKAVGIETQIKQYNYTLLYASVANGGIYQSGKFDINIYAWVSGADPDDSSQFMCDYIPPKGNNAFRFCDRGYDTQQNIALTHFDRATRKQAYARAQAIMAEQIPEVFLFYRKQIAALSPDLRGYAPNGITETWNAYRWSI